MPKSSKSEKPLPVRLLTLPFRAVGKVTLGVGKVLTSPLRRR